MLSAAVCGEVFTSPSTDAVLAAIRASAGPNGALLIVKNYTGDRLNFSRRRTRARRRHSGRDGHRRRRRVAARPRRAWPATRDRRHRADPQAAGAAAARGLPLARVAAIARDAAAELGTMGVALDGCTIPGADKAGFSLGDHEIGRPRHPWRKASNVAHRCRPMRWSTRCCRASSPISCSTAANASRCSSTASARRRTWSSRSCCAPRTTTCTGAASSSHARGPARSCRR